MNIFGIEFAPLNVPLQRRLQTLAAACWFTTLAFGSFFGLFLTIYLIIFTKYWWITLLYCFWALVIDRDVSESGGRPFKWVKNWTWWRYFRDYFPLKLEKVDGCDLDPNQNYLFCAFPHGMLSVGVFNAFGSSHGGFDKLFPHHSPRVVTLTQHYFMPFFRELALAFGGVAASSKAINYLLKRPGGGYVTVLLVGGAQESYYCRPGQYGVVLKKRKGFVKLALQNGTPLVPVISFGETDVFSQIDSPEGSLMRRFQEWLRGKIGMAPVIPIGRGFFQYSFGLIPQRRPVTTVVGKPIIVDKIENPTHDDINKVHALFTEKLTELFEEQKHNYVTNPETKKLEIY